MNSSRRLRILSAMDLEPQVLRGSESAPSIGADKILVVVMPQGSATDARQRALLDKLLAEIPLDADRMRRVQLDCGKLPGMNENVAALLVLGATQQEPSQLAVASHRGASPLMVASPNPAELLADPQRKRDAWLAIRQLRKLFGDGA